MRNRLLIISCSAAKVTSPEPLPAIERYNGPIFKLLRKFSREHPDLYAQMDTFILSAKYGLIPSNHQICHYDERMTHQKALSMRGEIQRKIKEILCNGTYNQVFLVLGKDYLDALGDKIEALFQGRVVCAQGSMGGRLAQMSSWLNGNTNLLSSNQKTQYHGAIILRGVEIKMTKEQAIAVIQDALHQDWAGANQFQTWYIEVDGEHLSPKWVIHSLTGLPVRSFHSSEARRVLAQLGFEVKSL